MCSLPADVFRGSRAVLLLGSILFCSSAEGLAQKLVEDFDAGFSVGLAWSGDTGAFRFREGRLRLLDERGGSAERAAVWLPAPTRDSACWSLNAELGFSPSASNRARFWLASDLPLDSAEPATGYYLDFGGVAGGDDAYSLYRRESDRATLVLATEPGTAAGDSLAVRVEVCRTPPGAWSLRVDELGSGRALARAQGASAKPLAGAYVGLELRYTSTRNGRFYFDNLTVDTSSTPLRPPPETGAARPRERFDLLFTELMADPTPPVGLPEVEYLEVYNNTDSALSLGGVLLTTRTAEAVLPDTLLPPRAYLALAKRAVAGTSLRTLPDFPALSNSGARLELVSADGILLDQLDFRPAWHSAGKRDGGWSLERVDLAEPCVLGAANWASSTSLAGGTPGEANSIRVGTARDSLQLNALSLLDSVTLLVSVNRVLARADGSFRVSGTRLDGVAEGTEALGTYRLTLGDPVPRGGTVGVGLASTAGSCVPGAGVSERVLRTGSALAPERGDWGINEIMYDPLRGDGRWVELINRSDHPLSTAAIRLALVDRAGEVQRIAAAEDSLSVVPGAFVVLAAEPLLLAGRYPNLPTGSVVAAEVPTLGEEDCLLVFSPPNERVIERVCYTQRWHNRAYANTDGVSLERIDALGPSGSASNWTSAALGPPSGTPGRGNSQASTRPQSASAGGTDARIRLLSERVSPDGDGYEDLLEVSFAFEEPGTLIDFEVVDLLGRSVYAPSASVSAGRAGRWTWDGVSTGGEVVPVGTYVLRASSWTESSRTRTHYLPFSVLKK